VFTKLYDVHIYMYIKPLKIKLIYVKKFACEHESELMNITALTNRKCIYFIYSLLPYHVCCHLFMINEPGTM